MWPSYYLHGRHCKHTHSCYLNVVYINIPHIYCIWCLLHIIIELCICHQSSVMYHSVWLWSLKYALQHSHVITSDTWDDNKAIIFSFVSMWPLIFLSGHIASYLWWHLMSNTITSSYTVHKLLCSYPKLWSWPVAIVQFEAMALHANFLQFSVWDMGY